MHEQRVSALRSKMARLNVDAFLLTNINNIFYFTGFTGSTAAVLVDFDKVRIVVDPRYCIQAQNECRQALVVRHAGNSFWDAIASLASSLGIARIAFEADNLTVSGYNELRKKTPKSISFKKTIGAAQDLRAVKDDFELCAISKAAQIAESAYKSVLNEITPGMTEKAVAALLEYRMRELGADGASFDIIAASGPNAACPHARPTERKLQHGDMLKLDFGARLDNYCSDITRTICIGQPSDLLKKAYKIVYDAQQLAISSIKPGMRGSDIDSIARRHISEAGYGDCFGHGLGHSIGIEVHDGPAFSTSSAVKLKTGMIVTVEPGIYLEGWGGVRIEDDIVVEEKGAKNLTNAPADLVCI